MDVLTYVPSNVILLVSGYQIEGWTEIRVARNAPGFKQIRGIRGKNTRTRIQDSSATITIKTFQTELLNEVFSTIHDIDLAQGTCRLEIALAETTGTTFFSTTTGYVLAYPEISYGSELGEVTWTVACDESAFQLGSARSVAVGIVQNSISQLKDFVNNVSSNVQNLMN